MAKGKNQRKAGNKQSIGSDRTQPPGSSTADNTLATGLKAVENMVEKMDGSEVGSLGQLLNKAKESYSSADEKGRKEAADKLDVNLQNLVGSLNSEITEAKSKRGELQSKLNNLEQRENHSNSLKNSLEELGRNLGLEKTSLESAQKRLAEQQAELADKERELEERLIDAEAGFSKRNLEMLDKFRQDKEQEGDFFEKKKEALADEANRLTEEIANLKISIESKNRDALAAMESRSKELDRKELSIEGGMATLQRSQKRLDMREKMLDKQREIDREDIKKEFLVELNRQENNIEELNNQIRKYIDLEKGYLKKLNSFAILKENLGGDNPEALFNRIESLKAKNEKLQAELDLKPSTDIEEKNRLLKQENRALLQARENQDAELAKVTTQMRQSRIAVIDKENLSRENLVLSKKNDLLDGRIKSLREEVDDLLSKQQSKAAFPALLQMDSSENHNRAAIVEKVTDLNTFVVDMRERIAWDGDSKKELYFQLEDIRLFIAGLSMSRLHILQGISGTGKTSLAKAFARAVGGGCETVSVQAGWRDKDDLIGHYNSFEKKFYERPCLQGIYEAQTPFYQDRPYIVLLDEMNLSRPEQYFAEFLSALELDESDQKLRLMTSALNGAPNMFVDGQDLQIPRNLWFIGTANHDETTFEFADKTYDRAHVMELPRHEETFNIDKTMSPVSYSYSSLEAAFATADEKYSDEISTDLETLNLSEFVSVLGDNLGVGWGNRLERQAHRFISSMLASGADKGEAFDHLLATKVLRHGKATGRYDTEREDIEKLINAMSTLSVDLGLKVELKKCQKLLENEARRKSAH